VLGVDDFALRRGQVYATVLIDAGTGQRIDVLAGRKAEALETWLRGHPGVQVVCRDGAGAYGEAVRRALPGAVQAGDRWHLWHGLRYITQGRAGADRPHLSSGRVARLLLTRPAALSDAQQALLSKLTAACPEMTSLAGLIRSSAALLKPDPGNDEKLQEWANAAQAADLPSVHAFTRGLDLDMAAATAAVTLPFHNGRTEGVNTKTKMIKRQMYGRAGFTLLRHRSCSANSTHRHHRK